MKKKILSIVLAVLMMALIPISVFAASGFNKAVFDNAEDVTIKSDDMSGISTISCTSLQNRKAVIDLNWSTLVAITPNVQLSDDVDTYSITFTYVAESWAFIDSIIVKIGDNRYTLSDFPTGRNVQHGGSIQENAYIFLTAELIPMMQDLIEHRDEEIKIRLCGSRENVDFTLPDNIKDGMINLYNLYVAGGGTNEPNMNAVYQMAPVTVSVKK